MHLILWLSDIFRLVDSLFYQRVNQSPGLKYLEHSGTPGSRLSQLDLWLQSHLLYNYYAIFHKIADQHILKKHTRDCSCSLGFEKLSFTTDVTKQATSIKENVNWPAKMTLSHFHLYEVSVGYTVVDTVGSVFKNKFFNKCVTEKVSVEFCHCSQCIQALKLH